MAAEQEQRGQGDPRGRPDERRKAGNGIETEPQPAGHNVDRRDGDDLDEGAEVGAAAGRRGGRRRPSRGQHVSPT